ncbi:MAG: mono/diheme cytochrome c family protein [Arcticibacterium sp.]|jgi:mono/diheme cytochrome c family protein
MKTLILLSVLSFIATSCSQNANKQAGNGAGLALYEKNCNSCHNASGSFGKRPAPPMVAIKLHYKLEREAFIDQVTSYVLNPTAGKSRMKGAINRFGLMPKQMVSEKEVRAIAAFVYDNDIESPDWFEEHRKQEMKMGQVEPKKYGQIGKTYATQTQQVLGKNIMAAMSNRGAENALEFCNTQAIPLTDSMATALSINIKRVSDKARNPRNKANEEELAYIHILQKQIAASEQLKPHVNPKGERVKTYYPIISNGMCLQCHGKNIKPNVASKINELYPEDLATGYDANEIRGIWVVEMDK